MDENTSQEDLAKEIAHGRRRIPVQRLCMQLLLLIVIALSVVASRGSGVCAAAGLPSYRQTRTRRQ